MKLTLCNRQLATAIIALHQVKLSKDDHERLAAMMGHGDLNSTLTINDKLMYFALQSARAKQSVTEWQSSKKPR